MMEWMIAHPWLTFWLGFFGLVIIDSIVANICNTIIHIHGNKNNSEKSLDKDENA